MSDCAEMSSTIEMINAASLMGALLGAFFGIGGFIILMAFSDWLSIKINAPKDAS